MNVQLEDLVAVYPDVTTPGFQTLISAKKEFRDLASYPNEPVPRRGEFYPHQVFTERFLRPYDRLLLAWRTGTGKTGGYIAPAEYYKKLARGLLALGMDPIFRTQIRRVYVLVKGPSLRNEFRNQLVCKFTPPGEYETKLVREARLETTRKSNLTREISKWYSVRTYKKLVNDIVKANMTDEDIKKRYSGCLFIVDEVHNLRSDPFSGETEVQLSTTYQTLWRVFHVIDRSKVLLGSATPMINDVSEIVPVMNLILPTNQQLDPNVDYRSVTIEQMEPYFRGRISFVRELDTGAVPVYQGQPLQAEYDLGGPLRLRSQNIIYALPMSPHQEAGYQRAREANEAFREDERQAANFVFPDGSYGGTFPRLMKRPDPSGDGRPEPVPHGLGKYVLSPSPDVYQITDELRPYLRLDQLQRMGCKFAEAVRLVLESQESAFCYNEFLTGCGAILLAMCFEANGFERFDETRSVFSGETGPELRPLCATTATAGQRNIRIRPKLRYALLTSETSDNKALAMMEAFNSYENRHGEYIRVLIGSPVTRDGINLANVLKIFLMGPSWNQSGMYQGVSRAIRSTSHEDLLNEKRAALAREGKDPALATVAVRIYQMAAITREGSSVDIEMYQNSEIKDWFIKRMERMMKQCAIDCQIHYLRNVRLADVDGTPACDYTVCRYSCYDPQPEALDVSTYDIYYSQPDVDMAIQLLINIFRVYTSVTLPQIYATFTDVRPKFIDMAIERLIVTKTALYDRFGYPSYLRVPGPAAGATGNYQGNAVFLQRDFPLGAIEDKYPLTYYTGALIANQTRPLREFVTAIQSQELTGVIDDIKKPGTANLDVLLDQLNLERKIELLEEALALQASQQPLPTWATVVLQKFRSAWHYVFEPVTLIQKSAQTLADKGKKRGRKPKTDTKPRARKVNPTVTADFVAQLDGNTEPVYFHTLSNQSYDRVAYNVTAKFNKAEGKTRLLKPSEGLVWRDATPAEYPVYNELAQYLITRLTEPYEQYPIYGTVYYDKKFRIRDKTTEDTGTLDARVINRGKTCNTWRKPELVNILLQLGVEPPEWVGPYPSRQEIIAFLVQQKVSANPADLNKYTTDQLHYIYAWLRSNVTRDQICDLLQTWFAKNNRLLVL